MDGRPACLWAVPVIQMMRVVGRWRQRTPSGCSLKGDGPWRNPIAHDPSRSHGQIGCAVEWQGAKPSKAMNNPNGIIRRVDPPRRNRPRRDA